MSTSDAPPESDQPVDMSLGSIFATLGTVLLVGLAGLGLYIDGAVLIYVGFIQPGVHTAFAAAYVVLAVAVPILVAHRMRRRDSTWRRTTAASAALILAVSVVFFPFAALAMAM